MCIGAFLLGLQFDAVSLPIFSGKKVFGKRGLDRILDNAPQFAPPKNTSGGRLRNARYGFARNFKFIPLLAKSLPKASQKKCRNLVRIFRREGLEDDDFVEAVYELGPEDAVSKYFFNKIFLKFRIRKA